MQVKDGRRAAPVLSRLLASRSVMITAFIVVANVCLQGGEQIELTMKG
jgi:hypothetical protein